MLIKNEKKTVDKQHMHISRAFLNNSMNFLSLNQLNLILSVNHMFHQKQFLERFISSFVYVYL